MSRAVPRRPYDLVIFDWDGTLMDSVGSIVECTHATLEELRLPPLADEVIRGSVGLSVAETIERLSPEGADPELGERIRSTYRRLWFGVYRDRPVTFPGVEELLRSLAEAEYLLAVATGKSRRGLERDLEVTGLGGHFLSTRTADDARSKPDPQMVLDLQEELGVRTERSLVVGDSVWDLRMAEAARTPSVAVATGAHPRERLLEHSPLACFERVTELEAWLQGEGS